MAIRRIEQLSCSLNLGLIYSLDYNYDPSSGTKIKIYFVNKQGEYTPPNMLPMQKVFIRIGGTNFNMYPVAYGVEKGPNRRVIWVEFEDEFFMLSKYYIVWPGRGCGTNVIPLGTPVSEKSSVSKFQFLNTSAVDIEEFTKLPDYEYSFDEFLAILRQKFNVQVNATYDGSIKRSDIYGSFLDVLQSWCSYYNLAFFFENSVIKIYNPVNLDIILPSKPAEAISYFVEEDIRSTYGKTVSNWFAQEGNQYPLNQATNDSNGPLFVRNATLFPVGYEFNLPQTALDPNQVIAAQYGENFWFLYNYWLGTTATNCGFTIIPNPESLPTIIQSIQSIGQRVAQVNETERAAKFEAYSEYGKSIAGRWYISNRKDDVSIDADYTWFSEATTPVGDFLTSSSQIIDVQILRPNDLSSQIIQDTVINKYYPGVNYFGSRLAYYDPYPYPTSSFTLTSTLQGEVNGLMENFTPLNGSTSMDFSQLGAENSYVGFTPVNFSEALVQKFQSISSQVNLLKPRYTSIPMRGVRTIDYTTAKAASQESSQVKVVRQNDGPNVIGNTAVLKTLEQGSYTVYYDKYEKCSSASTPDSYYQFRFEPQEVSSDNEIGITFRKLRDNTYELKRDYTLINTLVENPYLKSLAQARTFPTRRVTYTLNYFDSVPQNFLTKGLIGLNVSVTDNGIQATYTYSNEVLQVPNKMSAFVEFAQGIRNSWIRRYQPNVVIS